MCTRVLGRYSSRVEALYLFIVLHLVTRWIILTSGNEARYRCMVTHQYYGLTKLGRTSVTSPIQPTLPKLLHTVEGKLSSEWGSILYLLYVVSRKNGSSDVIVTKVVTAETVSQQSDCQSSSSKAYVDGRLLTSHQT